MKRVAVFIIGWAIVSILLELGYWSFGQVWSVSPAFSHEMFGLISLVMVTAAVTDGLYGEGA